MSTHIEAPKVGHTPGPWRYEPSTKTIRSVPANYWLATMDSWDGAVVHEANARLIAAAPELLAFAQSYNHAMAEASRTGRSTLPQSAVNTLFAQCRAAIAKAEGNA